MSTPRLPVTPVTPGAQKQQQPTPTGSWKHPRLLEITRRQHKSHFDERNVRAIVMNGIVLGLSFASLNITPTALALRFLQYLLHRVLGSSVYTLPYLTYLIWAIRSIFIFNIGYALRPLLLRRYADDIADIPLTPSQRQAMGLDPSISTPPTPGSTFVTPPRYPKSTPRSGFSNHGERGTPGSNGSRNSLGRTTSHSPFSANGNGSPLFHKVVAGSASKRIGLDGGSFLDSSLFSDSLSSNTPGTPTPGNGKASVSLNNKWLYEKRRDNRGSAIFN